MVVRVLRNVGLVLAFGTLGMVTGMVPARSAYGQNAVTGALTGVVTDPSGAVVPGASVTITDKATGAQQSVTTNGSGRYTISLLKPSNYTVVASLNGLQSATTSIAVLVGQEATADLKATPTAAGQTIEVSADTGQLTDTQSPALITTLTEHQVQNLPAPGGDITTVAFTAPGVVLNSGGAYGNFSSNGLPGTSNLYVLNGYDDEDPFLNLNNSGSSNLTLGQGEVSEAAVVQNGYTVQYGRAAGAILNYTTKSGGNAFHGSANYYYNGSILNANDWFRNQAGEGRPKAVSNEWAGNIGGPIIKDKLFFFGDYEGLRYVLPASGYVAFPTQAFQNAILGRIPSNLVPFYQQAFSLYNASPNFARAVPVTNGTASLLQDSTGTLGCGSAAALAIPDGTGGTFGTTSSCTSSTLGTASNINKEWLFTGRVDWNINERHKLFGRYKMDRGSQPTYTNFVSPVFNTISSQPAYEGQLNDTYTFSPNVTNQFIFAANWYTAFFGPANLNSTLAAFPTYLSSFIDGGSTGSSAFLGTGTLGLPNSYINGRNVSQYQFVDDLSVVKGNHTLRFGFNFRRDDISDFDAQQNFAGTYSLYLSDFANGNLSADGSSFSQSLTNNKTAYLALYNLGAYLQDEYLATPHLKLTAGIRFDRTGDPLCNNSCFSLYNGSFPQSGVTTSTPYNQLVNANQMHAFNNVQAVNPQGRVGFNYDVMGDGKTILRGGFGMFTDLYPAGFLDGFIQNLPNLYGAVVTRPAGVTNNNGYYVGPGGTSGTAINSSLASFNALESGFSAGASSSSIGAGFVTPNFVTAPNTFKNPTYLEFNLQAQRQIGKSDAIIVSYVGNTGYNEIIQNKGINAASASGFGGLPTAQADPNFLAVTDFTNAAHSNYHAGSVTYKHIDNHGLSADVTYTYSKAMDDASNSGITNEPYNFNSYYANSNTQIDPTNVARLNYSLADYDIRNSLTLDFVYEIPFKFQHAYETALLGGWTVSGKSFYRSGQPFTAYNSYASPANTGGTDGSGVLVDILNFGANRHCGPSAANPLTPCFGTADFQGYQSQTDLGNAPRNQFIGPHYADTDLNLGKRVFTREAMSLQIGTYAFNVANHPNFALPAANIAAGGLGSITSIAAPPTSPYGSFQGAGVGGRVLQVYGKFTF